MIRRLGRSGAAAMEFALVITPITLAVFGVLEFSRFIYSRNALQELAIATARCMGVVATGCQDGNHVYSDSATKTYVTTSAADLSINVPASQITLTKYATCGGVAGFAQATLTINLKTVVPQIITLFANGQTLSATACYPNQ